MIDLNDIITISNLEEHKILDNISDSIVILNPENNNIIYFNRATYESLGYDKNEFLNIGNSFFTDKNDTKFISRTHQQVLKGENVSFISKHITKNGSFQYAEISLSRIDLDNKPYICGIWKDVTRDVTEKRAANTKNKRLKDFFELLVLLNNSKEFLSTDIIKYGNLATPLISKTLDIDRVSIRLYNKGRSSLESVSLYDRNKNDRLPGKALDRSQYRDFFDYLESHEIIVVDDISESDVLKDMINVFFSEDGSINGLLASKITIENNVVGYIFLQSKQAIKWEREYILCASQISDQIRIMLTNKELKEHKVFLEKKVKERTKALEIAKEIAERSTINKTELLSNVSHEIRTPLNAIIGFLSLIETSNLDAKTKMYINYIKEGSDNLLDIINDVLDTAKMDAGKMKTHLTWIDLKTFFKKKVEFYLELFSNKNIEFIFNYKCEHYTFYTDIKLLSIIINNLLSNALKYTNEGRVKLEVVEMYKRDYKSNILIRVEDTGIGIKEKDFHKIFKTFEQIEQKSTNQNKGSGLGLALTKQIVELLDGQIIFNSKYAKGTVFSVSIPMQTQENQVQIGTINHLGSNFKDLKFPNKKILIVDDHEQNLAMLISFLQGTEIKIDTACNGLQALKKLDTERYDLILMDLQMPVLDGLTTCELIRLNKQYINLPIVALSANAYYKEEKIDKYNIFNDYLAKPIKKEKFIETCASLLLNFSATYDENIPTHNFLDLLKKFSLLVLEEGLAYVASNRKLFETVLFEFLEKHSRDFEYLISYIDENRIDDAYRLLHTLKSLVKTIGMNDIFIELITYEEIILKGKPINEYLDDIYLTKDLFEMRIYIINYIRHINDEKMRYYHEK